MPASYDVNDIATELARRALDAAYVAVGLGVLGLQRAQTARQDLLRAGESDERVARLRTGLASGAQQLGEWMEGTITLVGAQLQPIENQLPQPAREIADRARARLQAVGEQLRQAVVPGA